MTRTQRLAPAASAPAPFKLSRMARACVLATGALVATGAGAQLSTYSGIYGGLGYTAPTWSTTGFAFFITNGTGEQYNAGANTANVVTPGIGTFQTGGSSTNTVTSNSILATARGNTATNSQTMANLVNNGVGDDGLGIAQSQKNGAAAAPAPQIATITGSALAGTIIINLQDSDAAAPQVLSSNTVRASSILNVMDNAITGIGPVGYTSTATGQATANLSGGTLLSTSSSGGLNINAVQVSENSGAAAGSQAAVTNTVVRLDIHHPGGAPIVLSSNLAVNNNTVAAEYGGNSGSNIVRADVGSGSFTGAASVTNAQVNLEAAVSANSTALVNGAGVTADVRGTLGNFNSLSATLDLTSNTVSATSRGNDVTNGISFLSGSSVTGSGTPVVVNSATADVAASIDVTPTADVAVANLQVNNTTTMRSTMGSVTPTVISASTDDLLGGTVNVTSNTATSTSSGNTSVNVIAATAATYAATTAVGSTQSNDGTTIASTNTGTTVRAQTGADGVVSTGTVNVSSNSIGSAATGNANTSQVVVSPANTITALTDQAASGSAINALNASGVAQSVATAGVSVNTVQSNTAVGGANTISATLTNANVINTSSDAVALTSVDVIASTFTATSNSLTAAATGNSNTASATLSGATVNVNAAVASAQYNAATVSGTVTSTAGNGTGVTVATGGADSSTLSVSANNVAASGTGNTGSNSLSVSANNLTAGPAAYAGATTAESTASTGVLATNAAFSVSSVQNNEGGVTSSNRTRTDFASITAGTEGVAGIAASTLSVTGNTATSTTSANVSSNSLALAPGLLATSDGASAQLGSVANLQTNVHGLTESSRVGGQGAGQVIGITFQEAVDAASTLTVTGNALRATSRGNDTTNSLSASIGNFSATIAALPNGNVSSADTGNTGTNSATADFAVVNNQSDAIVGRTATADNIIVGIDDAAGTIVQTMNGQLTVSGNTASSESRNNNAANSLVLSGATGTLAGTAGLLNQQSSSTPTTATTESTFRIRASGTVNAIGSDPAVATNITMTGNQSSAVAVGNSASNAVVASGVVLTGNGNIAATGQGFDGTTSATTADADFIAMNVQQQTGAVTAGNTGSVRLIVDGSQVVSTIGATQLTVTGNSMQALAQANSARTTLDLAGTDATASAALANVQEAGGNVTATHTSPTTAGGDTPAYLIMAGDPLGVTGANMTVTGNSTSVSAGQNAADNWLQTNSVTLAGRGLGTNLASYDNVTGTGSATTDLSVMNVQRATGGAVSATSLQPGDIGAQVELMDGGSLAVTGNSVSATGTINNASNLLAMDRAGAPTTVSVSATGAVVNGQGNTAGQTVTATVGDAALQTNVGLKSEPAGGTTTVTNVAGDPVVNVTGNTLSSSASGNIATNAASVSATATYALAAAGSSLAVVSDQLNNATMTATTRNIAVGVNAGTAVAGETSLTGATVNVTGNVARASGAGNTVTNTVSATADLITGGDAATASVSIANNQVNALGATVTTLVDRVSAGVDASGATGLVDGSTVNVISNRMQALGYASSATNTLSVNAATSLSSDASATITNVQDNQDVGGVSSTASNIRAGVFAGANTITDAATGTTVVTVSGNGVAAVGGGNTATSVLNGSAGAILAPSAVSPTFALTSTQTNAGANNATATTVTLGVMSGDLIGNSTVNVLSNSVQSSAYGNDDANTMNLTATAGSASMFSGNLTGTQTNTGALTANTNTVDIGYFNSAVGGSVATTTTLQVSGNTVTGTAGANTAANVLNMTAGMASGTPLTPNFALNQTQTNDVTGTVASSVTGVRVGVTVSDAASTVAATGINTLSNTIQSSAYANSSNNTLNLTATAGTTTAFTGALNNTQSNAAGATSAVSGITIGPVIGGMSTDTPMTISGNVVNAIGGGNTTVNTLNAVSGAAFGTPVAAPPAMYDLSNTQTNTGAVGVTALNVNIGAMPTAITSTGSVNFGVLGNSIQATGYGNAATNTVAVTTPLWGGAPVASASLQNSQTNLANISASVTTSTIGVGMTSPTGVTGVGAQTMVVTGNSIGAQAIGNSAVNRITSR